jgi:nucleoside-diphosphate-sugar epimerase
MDQVIDFELDAALFRWLSEVEVTKVVYISSSAAYPIALQTGVEPIQLAEEDIDLKEPWLPDALYGWTKLTGEVMAQHALTAGHDVLVIRPFSGYGEDQADCYPFPAIMKRAIAGDDPFVVWGSGGQARDFVHVSDIVGATLAFVQAGVQGPINIGTGRPTSMSTLATMAAAQCGFTPIIQPMTGEPEGVLYRVADTSLMEHYYTPKVSLEEGIAWAIRHFKGL